MLSLAPDEETAAFAQDHLIVASANLALVYRISDTRASVFWPNLT
jgi:hypothetical protein